MCVCVCVYLGGACGVIVIVDTAARAQIPDETVCISLSANTFGKGLYSTILSPQTGVFNFGMATDLGEGKLWIQTW